MWAKFEDTGLGITAETAKTRIYGYSFDEGLYLLTFGFFFWTALGLYLDYVLP